MYTGLNSNVTDQSMTLHYGDGITKAFGTSATLYLDRTLVFLDGTLQTSGITFDNNLVNFEVAPALGTKVLICIMQGIRYNPYEIATGAVSSSKLTGHPKTLSLLQIPTANVIYSTGLSSLSVFEINELTKSLTASNSDVELGTNLDTLVDTGSQTITGSKTFSSIPNIPRKPITWLSKSGHNTILMLRGGELYSTSGTAASYNNGATGRGISGQPLLFGGDKFKNVPIPVYSPIKSAGLRGSGVAYALLENGDLYTWGYNSSSGACGLGHTNQVGFPTLSNTGVVEVFNSNGTNGDGLGGEYNSNDGARLIIRKTDGYLYGAGHNGDGQFGLGHTTTPQPSWVQLTSLGTNVTKVFNCSSYGGCVFVQKSDYTIWVTGRNFNGQLGLSTLTNITTFTDVTTNWQGGTGWVLEHVTGGWNYFDGANASYAATTVMLLRNDSTGATKVLTCGSNAWGSMGDGSTTQKTAPYLIPNSGDVKKIAGNGGAPNTVHMLNNDGTLYAWGHNTYGAMGDGTAVSKTSPTLVQSNVVDMFVDQMSHWNVGYKSLQIIKKTDGLYYITGFNGSGACGLGHATTPVTSFTQMILPRNEDFVEFGWISGTTTDCYAMFGRTATHKLYTWGYNGHNAIIMNNTNNCLVPVRINFGD